MEKKERNGHILALLVRFGLTDVCPSYSRYDLIQAEHVVPAVDTIVAECEDKLADLESRISAGTLEPTELFTESVTMHTGPPTRMCSRGRCWDAPGIAPRCQEMQHRNPS